MKRALPFLCAMFFGTAACNSPASVESDDGHADELALSSQQCERELAQPWPFAVAPKPRTTVECDTVKGMLRHSYAFITLVGQPSPQSLQAVVDTYSPNAEFVSNTFRPPARSRFGAAELPEGSTTRAAINRKPGSNLTVYAAEVVGRTFNFMFEFDNDSINVGAAGAVGAGIARASSATGTNGPAATRRRPSPGSFLRLESERDARGERR